MVEYVLIGKGECVQPILQGGFKERGFVVRGDQVFSAGDMFAPKEMDERKWFSVLMQSAGLSDSRPVALCSINVS